MRAARKQRKHAIDELTEFTAITHRWRNQSHGTISAAFVDFSGSWCGTLPLGAENTNTTRLTAPDISGFSLSTACAGGSREYKTHCVGNTCWPFVVRFFQPPGALYPQGQRQGHILQLYTVLEKTKHNERRKAMFSAPYFWCTRIPSHTAVEVAA